MDNTETHFRFERQAQQWKAKKTVKFEIREVGNNSVGFSHLFRLLHLTIKFLSDPKLSIWKIFWEKYHD